MEVVYSRKERQTLERQLHVEILPGTEIMTDVGGHEFVKGKSSDQVLVPQPSADPHDPLNWSPLWKAFCITASSIVSFTQSFGPLSLAPMFPYYIKDFESSLTDVVQFTAVAVLVLGFSNFFWVPMSTSFGRRPVLIFSQLINVGASIWRARAQSYGSFIGACALNGFAAGPCEAIQPAVIADIFFLHERGRWNTFYWVVSMGAVMVAPIISGSMAETVGWRNFWWLFTAMSAVSLLINIFFFPETKYERGPVSDGSSNDSTPPNEKLDSNDELTLKSTTSASTSEFSKIPAVEQNQHLGKGKPARYQFNLFQKNKHPWKTIGLDLITPWWLFFFPIVQFASFVVSWSCSSFLTLNLTQSQVFAAPPYHFTSTKVGYTNFAIVGGAIIGLLTAGPLSDWISKRATIKNNGIREPEMRLPAMIPYVLVMILGNIIVAVGYEHKWPWEVIVIIGYGAAGLQVAAIPAIVSTYAVDSYKPVAGALFVSITVNKNLWAYGFAKFITPWTESAGFIKPIMTNMALATAWCLFGFLFYYKGKTFRRWTRNSRVHTYDLLCST